MARPRQDRGARHLRLLTHDDDRAPVREDADVLLVLSDALAAAAAEAPAASRHWTLDAAGPVAVRVPVDASILHRLVLVLLEDVVAASRAGSGLVISVAAASTGVEVRFTEDGVVARDVPSSAQPLVTALGARLDRGAEGLGRWTCLTLPPARRT